MIEKLYLFQIMNILKDRRKQRARNIKHTPTFLSVKCRFLVEIFTFFTFLQLN